MKMIQSKDVPDAIVEPALATAPSIAILRIPSARLIVMLKKSTCSDIFLIQQQTVAKQSPIMRRHCGYHLESAAEPKPAVARLSHVKPFHGFLHVSVISGGSRRVGESAAPQKLQHVKACVVRPDQISPATVCGGVGDLSCWCAALIHTRKRNPADT